LDNLIQFVEAETKTPTMKMASGSAPPNFSKHLDDIREYRSKYGPQSIEKSASGKEE